MRQVCRILITVAVFTLGAIVPLAAEVAPAPQGATVIKSPDGRLAIGFQILDPDATPAKGAGQLAFSVTYQGKPLLDASPMGLTLSSGKPLGAEVSLAGSTPSQTDETNKLVTGKVSTVRNHYNALRLDVAESGADGRKLTIEARAYDDAVAFRYVVPADGKFERGFALARENTRFCISRDAIAYAAILANMHTQYESLYQKIPLSGLNNQGGIRSELLLGCPLLMEVPTVGWMAITEADMRGTSAMYLMNTSPDWGGHYLDVKLAPDMVDSKVAVTCGLPYHSAWRVMMVADNPGKLIESNVITSLNPESQIKDTTWIKAGKASWNWWGGSRGADQQPAMNTEAMKYYIDFSAKNGLEYMLVDAGWSERFDLTKLNPAVDIPELVRYGASKGVKIWVWGHWAAVDRGMEKAFPMLEKWGVAGIKIDFMSSDDQWMTEYYYRVAELAAKHHLMVDFHGATKPTGMERTWPNVLGYEGVHGMEQSKAGLTDDPAHHVTLPFTRMLAGQMDYTPGGFDNVTRDEFVPRQFDPMVQGTRAHDLAMYAVYEAPFQMVSDHPTAYEGQPAFQFIKDVPATWDETKFVSGAPGESVAIARRNGDAWYLGAMTNWTGREIEIPLTFLGAGRYTAEIYADAPDADKNPKNVAISKKTVKNNATLKATLAPGGGYAVRFVPVK